MQGSHPELKSLVDQNYPKNGELTGPVQPAGFILAIAAREC